jgi:hypothetical protein
MHSVGNAIVDKLIVDALNEEIAPSFKVGERVQFYRKGYADKGEKEPTLAINGIVRRIDPKTGWLHVEHRWGWAVVKPSDEKVQLLQHKKAKLNLADAATELDGEPVDETVIARKSLMFAEMYGGNLKTVVKGTWSGNGPNPQNIKRV